jgi:phosphoribosylformimino-5-aminoimidazole carboxamide ribotide isomerase
MIIYPAMDLMGGRVVRLAQGRFEDATTYPAEPLDALLAFAKAGAEWAHVVDLEGARARRPVQHDLIAALAAEAPLKLQVAGGFRTAEQVARLLEAGAGRVVIGSLAVTHPETLTPSSTRSAATASRFRSTCGFRTACRWSLRPAGPRIAGSACGTSPPVSQACATCC